MAEAFYLKTILIISTMGIFDFFKNKPNLSNFDDQEIHLESAKRGGQESLLKLLQQQPTTIRRRTLDSWKRAMVSAQKQDDPNRNLLYDEIDSMMLDPHLASLVESRILPVVRSKFAIYNANSGDEVPELTALFETSWFERYITYAMQALFYGTTVVDLTEIGEDGHIDKAFLVPRRHVRPELDIIVEQMGATQGYKYKEPPYSLYYAQIGEDRDLGLLANLAPVVMAKKFALSAWQDFTEKYGIPPRWVTSSSINNTRLKQLSSMMQNLISSSWAILEGDEKIETMDFKGANDPYKVFDQLIIRINSELSKRILGQDGTTDNKDASGTYGSLKILHGVALDRHLSDKARIKYHINGELIPKLIKLGYPLQGMTFDWDEFNELSPTELIDAVVKLSSAYEIDPDYITEKTGIPINGVKTNASYSSIEAKKKA